MAWHRETQCATTNPVGIIYIWIYLIPYIYYMPEIILVFMTENLCACRKLNWLTLQSKMWRLVSDCGNAACCIWTCLAFHSLRYFQSFQIFLKTSKTWDLSPDIKVLRPVLGEVYRSKCLSRRNRLYFCLLDISFGIAWNCSTCL